MQLLRDCARHSFTSNVGIKYAIPVERGTTIARAQLEAMSGASLQFPPGLLSDGDD